ncbi:unnamed protein product [Ambrosiozyma monospora]|uniref:Unnamed protein product n=1 Tax=Ambrosiozyma monospora TaxID=43982 RepID=A0ACB5U7U3_AMBMO|nr:unnamed protein product [Ambrosiozyma monospora]
MSNSLEIKRLSKNLTASFHIDYPNKQHIYTAQQNRVSGYFQVHFKRNLRNVQSIHLGFKGDVKTRVASRKGLGQLKIDSRVDVLFNKSVVAFEQEPIPHQDHHYQPQHSKQQPKSILSPSSSTLPDEVLKAINDCSSPSSNITKVSFDSEATRTSIDKLRYPIDFEFPSDRILLPSSCDSLGAINAHRTNITVRYELYVLV